MLAISQVDDESQLSQESALPSSTRPSDHVSLVATFMFHDAEPEQQVSRVKTVTEDMFGEGCFRQVIGWKRGELVMQEVLFLSNLELNWRRCAGAA